MENNGTKDQERGGEDSRGLCLFYNRGYFFFLFLLLFCCWHVLIMVLLFCLEPRARSS
jgi:hypothetical protein